MSGDFLTDDLSTFFSEDEFAVSATHTPYGGSESDPFSIIFDPGYITIDPETGDDVTVNPSATCAEADVSGIGHKSVFTINSVNYVVHIFNAENGVLSIEFHK